MRSTISIHNIAHTRSIVRVSLSFFLLLYLIKLILFACAHLALKLLKCTFSLES